MLVRHAPPVIVALALLGPGLAWAAPNLQITTLDAPDWWVAGDSLQIHVVVSNTGSSRADASRVGFGVSADANLYTPVLCDFPVDPLDAGATADLIVGCTYPGSYHFRRAGVLVARADYQYAVGESVENDNDRTTPVFLADAEAAELLLTSSNPPVLASPMEAITIPFVISNVGRVDASRVLVRFRLSTDAVVDHSDPWLCDAFVETLAQGTTTTRYAADCVVPDNTAGHRWIVGRVDALNLTPEWQESNNAFAVPIRVGPILQTPASIALTGSAGDDFVGRPITVVVDGAAPDRPLGARLASGFDLRQIVYTYDVPTDTLYVGAATWWDSVSAAPTLFGDADGDGDAGSMSAAFLSYGADSAALGTDETFSTLFLPTYRGTSVLLPLLDSAIAGVPYSANLLAPTYTTLTSMLPAADPSDHFGTAIAGASIPSITTARSGQPHLEMKIRGFLGAWPSVSSSEVLLRTWGWASTRAAPGFGGDSAPTSRFGVALCLGDATDDDRDGYAACDCDDSDDTVNPAAWEICDGLDNDCDGITENVLSASCLADPDQDGLNAAQETAAGTSDKDWDTDKDGLSDGDEATYGSSPTDPDSDNGGVEDGAEVADGRNPMFAKDDDIDGDGLGAHDESTHGTDDRDRDSDNDGLSDSDEVALGTNPNELDSDRDGLEDGAEVEDWFTDPLAVDSDGGGIDDLTEVTNGDDPTWDGDDDPDHDGLINFDEDFQGSSRTNPDSDGDGLSDGDEVHVWNTEPTNADTDGGGDEDGFEVDVGTSPIDWTDDDGDNDGLANGDEQDVGTSWTDPDEDNDGALDGEEVYGADGVANNGDETDPFIPDSDSDGLSDGDEIHGTGPLDVWAPTDPTEIDTDGDGLGDGAEVDTGSDPNDPNDPNPTDTDVPDTDVPDTDVPDTDGADTDDTTVDDTDTTVDDTDNATDTDAAEDTDLSINPLPDAPPFWFCSTTGGSPRSLAVGASVLALAFARRRTVRRR